MPLKRFDVAANLNTHRDAQSDSEPVILESASLVGVLEFVSNTNVYSSQPNGEYFTSRLRVPAS